MKRYRKPLTIGFVLFGLLALLGAVLPASGANILSRVLIMMLFATAVNVMFGHSGLIAFGQGVFFGGAAYIYVLLVVNVGLNHWLALLLTMPRIPQLYYGTEILMNGTKRVTDGNVRRDFPGGFPGDTRNCFTAQGRTAAQNDMFTWLSRVLHWRQGNEVVTRGRTTQFIPHDGVYVLARRLGNRSVVTVINGTTQPRQLPLERYREVLGNATQALDVPTATAVSLAGTALSLPPRGVFLLDIAL